MRLTRGKLGHLRRVELDERRGAAALFVEFLEREARPLVFAKGEEPLEVADGEIEIASEVARDFARILEKSDTQVVAGRADERGVEKAEEIAPAFFRAVGELQAIERPYRVGHGVENALDERRDGRRLFAPVIVELDGALAERGRERGVTADVLAIRRCNVARATELDADRFEARPCVHARGFAANRGEGLLELFGCSRRVVAQMLVSRPPCRSA